ncbi:hypothetical protein P0136_09485 [Lentisphaerota bacterium ZTH]|nr:hypothetical protein JYG24_13000 [Lentisphaerota bacterium]WET05596.1 hypothetical protein P0136_09485 [Lentisphaerota bacterium ZTH]
MRKFFPGTHRVLTVCLLTAAIVVLSICTQAVTPKQSDYPHWNFQDKASYNKLKHINDFIEENKSKPIIAAFDWDGTLFFEKIPVAELDGERFPGQPAFYLWMAQNASNLDFPVFPMQDTADRKFKENVMSFTRYIEGRTNVPWQGYPTFIANSLLLAGMTPENIIDGVQLFLSEKDARTLLYLPMFDVLQKFVDSGIEVWIITGSNQHFVAAEIKYIEENFKYSSTLNYKFGISTAPYNPETGHIAGNSLKLLKNGKFSNFYDDRYVNSPNGKLYIVNKEGKVIAMKKIEKNTGKSFEFAAGNSGGDYNMLEYVASKPDSLCIAVEPRGSLCELLSRFPETIIELTTEEVMLKQSTLLAAGK